MNYDVIGDLHGQAGKLEALLARLGYKDCGGSYRHPDRTAIFVGDFIDRGDRQLDTVNTVRRMVDAGRALAIMGNHEFNAIAWHQPDPDAPGEYLRPRQGALGQHNRSQHQAFLREVEHDAKLHAEIIDWFLTLPLWLDLPELRVVHACWHPGYMDSLRPLLDSGLRLNRDLMVAASREHRIEFSTVEGLTKGIEVALPDGHEFADKDGHQRRNVRVRWWGTESSSYRDVAMLDDQQRAGLPASTVPGGVRPGYDNAKPVFFGHYWMTGQPMLQAPHVACVDYSAGNGGPLVAYRWEGEHQLSSDRFVAVG